MARAFDSGYIAPCGPQVDAFERRLAELSWRRYAVAVSSGTAAMDLLMEDFGVDRGWTVIAPTLTFVATVGPAAHRGAKLVFVDSDATGNVDCALLRQALADETRKHDPKKTLFIGVDLYGRCCDYRAIAALCREYKVKFVCDSAEAVGAKGAGAAGIAAIYSFNGNKIVTTSGGGALLTDDRGIAVRSKKRSQQSREPVAWYQHREVGFNYRLSNILAAIGLAQLRRLPEILKKRRETAETYRRFCVEAGFEMLPPVHGENNWLNVVILKNRRERDKLIASLEAERIEARPVWKPLHLQPVFKGCKVYGGRVAEDLFARGVCLPSGTGLAPEDIDRICHVITSIRKSGKNGKTH